MQNILSFFGFSYHKEQGQVILLVVLVMVVGMTVGLSLASRNIVQLKTSTEEVNAQQAFSAAEAGIEEALQTGSGVTGKSLGNNSTISTVTINNVQNSSLILNNGNAVYQDDGIDVWLSTYPSYASPLTGKLIVYWGTSSTACNDPAIEIMLLSGVTTSPTMARYALDHNDCARNSGNNFSNANAGATISGQAFKYSTTISYTNGLVARIIPLYSNGVVAVANTDNSNNPVPLPVQGQLITSTGVSGDTTRKLTYYQNYKGVPSEFFYSLFQTQ